jgi:hypothetical protein
MALAEVCLLCVFLLSKTWASDDDEQVVHDFRSYDGQGMVLPDHGGW